MWRRLLRSAPGPSSADAAALVRRSRRAAAFWRWIARRFPATTSSPVAGSIDELMFPPVALASFGPRTGWWPHGGARLIDEHQNEHPVPPCAANVRSLAGRGSCSLSALARSEVEVSQVMVMTVEQGRGRSAPITGEGVPVGRIRHRRSGGQPRVKPVCRRRCRPQPREGGYRCTERRARLLRRAPHGTGRRRAGARAAPARRRRQRQQPDEQRPICCHPRRWARRCCRCLYPRHSVPAGSRSSKIRI
jgi:hypothetical protein